MIQPFDDYWSGCGGLRASSIDKRWVLVISIPDDKNDFDQSRDISLVDLKNFKNKECALSLYKNNDLGCESAEEISINPLSGDVKIHISNDWLSGTTSGQFSATELEFEHPDGHIVLSSVAIPKTKLFHFCGG